MLLRGTGVGSTPAGVPGTGVAPGKDATPDMGRDMPPDMGMDPAIIACCCCCCMPSPMPRPSPRPSKLPLSPPWPCSCGSTCCSAAVSE